MKRVPFDPSEVDDAEDVTGFYGMKVKKYKTPISPKENYRLAYERKLPFWLPTMNDALTLSPRIDPDNIARCQCVESNPLPREEFVGGKDKFGIEWVYVPMAGGSMVKPGSPTLHDANDWKSAISFPDIETWDWEGTKTANADYIITDKFISITILTGFFERLISFMDFDNAAVAMIDEDQTDAVHALFEALADLYIKMVDKYIYCYGIEHLRLHDDWGSQRAPFFSLATVREMIVPHLKKVADYCHSRGVFFELHSCGKNELLVPAYIEAGCDSWCGQPINDYEMLCEKYGSKLIMYVNPDFPPTPIKVMMGGGSRPPVDMEEAKASAKRYVEKYCANYAEKPVFCGGFGIPGELFDALYAETRRAFCP